MSRFVYLVLDGVGAGAMPDADRYGDVGANTLGNVAALVDLSLPTLTSLGLGCVLPLRGVPPVERPLALPGRLGERSAGKDTTAGHWEHMGVVTATPFPTYPRGFPKEVLDPFRRQIGREVLGNKPASGTEIIAELGEEHLRTGRPIVYTSADSVFQIACHVDVVPLDELYRYCRIARTILDGPHAVARVIARPFASTPGHFVRTKDRKDFSLEPPSPTYLDLLTERGVPVLGIGKIHQIFAGRGVGEEWKVASNDENLEVLARTLASDRHGVIMSNLVDFDMAWGHRNDVDGFAAGLEAVDAALPELLRLLGPDDRLLLTADHGVDPTTVSTDHSREYVPLLLWPRPTHAPARRYEGTMTDTGATVFAHFFPRESPPLGGTPLQRPVPEHRWRPYPAVQPGSASAGPLQAGGCRLGPEDVERAASVLAKRLGPAPALAVVLGSGLDALSESLGDVTALPFAAIPGWPTTGVQGHAGTVLVGRRGGVRLALVRGRVHGYEGYDRSELQSAVRTLARWGIGHLLLTAAVGGLAPELDPGSVALVTEVLDLQGPPPGAAPVLRRATAPGVASALAGLDLPPVRYAAVPGPQYETPAEVRLLRHLGAHVVGMSLAAEVAAAADEALETTVLAVVTNAAGVAGLPPPDSAQAAEDLVHQDVLAVGEASLLPVLSVVDALLDRGG